MDVTPQQQSNQVQAPGIGFQLPPYTEEDAKNFKDKQINDISIESKRMLDAERADAESNVPKITIVDENETSPKEDEKELTELMIMFSEVSVRRAFARKVFAILSLLLLKTVLFCALSIYWKPLHSFWNDSPLYIFIGMPIYVCTIIIIMCCGTIRRTYPWNIILLLLFSSSLTFMIGGLCAILKEETVMIAFGMTTVLVVGLLFFACQNCYEFTPAKMLITSSSLVLILTVVTALSWLSDGGRIALAGLVLFIFSILLVYDVLCIIDGTHSYQISPEEHIFAVTVLYLDIINLFLHIIRIIR